MKLTRTTFRIAHKERLFDVMFEPHPTMKKKLYAIVVEHDAESAAGTYDANHIKTPKLHHAKKYIREYLRS